LQCTIALFVAFYAKAEPTPENAPVARVGNTVLAKNGSAFVVSPESIAKDPPST